MADRGTAVLKSMSPLDYDGATFTNMALPITALVKTPTVYKTGTFTNRLFPITGTQPTILSGGGGSAPTPVARRYNFDTETWDLIPGP